MGRVLHCKITRFIDDTDKKSAAGEAERVLSACFKSLNVTNVIYLRKQYSALEGAEIISNQFLTPTLPVKSTPELLGQIMGRDLTMESSQGVTTFGINFKIGPISDAYGCTLYYRPGALPLLELGVLYFQEQRSAAQWAAELLSTGDVHVIRTATDWLRLHKYYGSGDHRYLLWKRGQLFRQPKAGEDAILAGLVLREICHSEVDPIL